MSNTNYYHKSAQVAVNSVDQLLTADRTVLQILGAKVTDTGSSIATILSGFRVCRTGLYNVAYTVTFTPSAAGTLVAQLYADGQALPCSMTELTVASGSTYTFVIEAPAFVVRACCNSDTVITAELSGVPGTVSYVSASAVKLA